jgi:hypothetical protein
MADLLTPPVGKTVGFEAVARPDFDTLLRLFLVAGSLPRVDLVRSAPLSDASASLKPLEASEKSESCCSFRLLGERLPSCKFVIDMSRTSSADAGVSIPITYHRAFPGFTRFQSSQRVLDDLFGGHYSSWMKM